MSFNLYKKRFLKAIGITPETASDDAVDYERILKYPGLQKNILDLVAYKLDEIGFAETGKLKLDYNNREVARGVEKLLSFGYLNKESFRDDVQKLFADTEIRDRNSSEINPSKFLERALFLQADHLGALVSYLENNKGIPEQQHTPEYEQAQLELAQAYHGAWMIARNAGLTLRTPTPVALDGLGTTLEILDRIEAARPRKQQRH